MNSVRDRLESILTRLEARAASEHVFSKVYAQQARAEADASDARLRDRRPVSPLDGRIVSIKDLFDVAGEPTLAGSVIRRDVAPATQDATIVRRLRDAGAVIVGKTHMTEFAFTSGLGTGRAGKYVSHSVSHPQICRRSLSGLSFVEDVDRTGK